MIRSINYVVIATLACVGIANSGASVWLVLPLNFLMCAAVFALTKAIDKRDNEYLFSFIVSLPFVLYWTEEYNEAAAQTFPLFLATTVLCISLPFVFILLFDLWGLAGED